MPTLGLGLPVYNGEKFLVELLDSLLAQEFTDWELAVCDNASTDATETIVKDYAARDARIRYHRHPANLGLAANHRFAFEQSRGEFFAYVQSDNAYEPAFFGRCVAELRARPDASCVYTATVDIDENGHRLRLWGDEGIRGDHPDVAVRVRDLTDRDYECFFFFGVVRRAVLARTSVHGSFESADRVIAVELALRGRLIMLDEPLFLHREHAGRVARRAPTARSRYLILDPRWQGKVPFPIVRLGWQYVRAILVAPLPARQKARCLWALRGWLRLNWSRVLRTLARGGYEYVKLGLAASRQAVRKSAR